jgi:autotransporter-associated beta strand protein
VTNPRPAGNTLTLSGDNGYEGGTSVGTGTLDVQTTSSLPGYDGSSAGSSAVTVAAEATLAVMVGGSGEWNSGSTDDIGTLLGNVSFASAATLGIDTTYATSGFTYYGSIADSSAGPLNFVVFGGNSVTLSGSNSYTGITTVLAGNLYMGAANALSSSTVVNLSGGGMDLDGYSQAIGGLTGSSAQNLTFDGGQLTIDTSGPETFSGTLSGSTGSQLIVAGSATQILSGSTGSDYGGTIEVQAGATLEAKSPASLGNSLANVTVDDTATLAVMVGGSGYWESTDVGNLLGSDGAVFNDGAAVGFDTTDGDFTYSDAIADTSTGQLRLVVLGNNILTLSGSNTYSDGTTVLTGTLDAESTGALPGYDLPGQVTVAASATLAVYRGSSNWTSAEIYSLLGNASFSAGASLGIDTTVASFSYSDNLQDTAAGPLGLTVLGGYTLNLTGSTINYTGITDIVSGTLAMGEANELSSSTVVNMAGGTLELDGHNLSIGGLTGTSGTVELGSSTLDVGNSSNDTYSGAITGSGELVIDGSATQTIVGDNSFSGVIVVNDGATLDSGSPDALGGTSNFGNITVDTGGTFAVVGGTDNWTSTNIASLLENAHFDSDASLGIDTSAGSFSDSGVIADTAVDDPLRLVVLGGNTLTLSGDNTYSDGTSIVAAMLAMGAADSIPASSPVTVSGTASTLETNGYFQCGDIGNYRQPVGKRRKLWRSR